MLILTRRIGENVKIFDNQDLNEMLLKLTVLSVKGCQVKFGLDAEPQHIILRDEIYRRIAAERNLDPIEDTYTREDIIKIFHRKNPVAGRNIEQRRNKETTTWRAA